MSEIKEIEKHSIELGNLDKVFYPKEGYTKGNVVEYYEKISEIMLPHLKDRPLTMIRFPNGIDDKRFFQKDAPDYFPQWIETKSIKKEDGGTTHYVICNNQASLVYLANQACITPHIWLSKKKKPDYPNRMIFDLDPSKNDFSEVKKAAQILYSLLHDHLALPVYVMTTGSRGLHVAVPIKSTRNYDQVREFAQEIAHFLENEHPDLFTTSVRKNKRDDKLFLDVARNGFAQTTVAPYALRPIEGAPVATPLNWEELSKNSLTSQSYNMSNIFHRLARIQDPWKDINKNRVVLTSAMRKLKKMKK